MARRRARALFDLCAGFVYSQVLLACVQLKVFDELRYGPQRLDKLAAALGLSTAATLTLMRAAAALGLAQRRGTEDVFGLGIHGAALLGNPGLMPMIEHHALFYADMQNPVELLRGSQARTKLRDFWAYARSERPAATADARVRGYSALMSASQTLIVEQILDAYSFGRHRCLLDVGGGDGTFAAAVAQRAPNLRVVLFDLPAVAVLARTRFASNKLSRRATAHGGDFLLDPLPLGSDIVSLIRVLHDHDDDDVIRILTAARRALPSHGRILVAEPLAGTPGGASVADAYFGFYLLAMGSGRARTFEELSALLAAAGFVAPRLLSTPLPAQMRVMVANINV